ncbi:MAG: lipopolysaccharide biosynthesis protein [Candidatus Symbiothrix sp.]|jgi:O-antigen/teichoic acid export membrane protein|nr:lipopolysaccharide biosynthesis protein [Candidatus Symbiothrix sp.]
MAETNLKHKAAHGLLWGGISNGIQQLLGVVFGIFLARILNKTDYGMVGVLAIFTGIAAIIINSGFSVALTNKKEADHKDYNAVFWFTVFVGVGLYVILFFCAPLIARFYQQPVLTDLSRFLFLGFLFAGLGTASSTIMFKQLMVKQQAIIGIISLLVSLSAGLTLALNGYAYWSIAVQMVLQVMLTSILTIVIAPWKPTFPIDFSPLKSMLPFSIKLFFTHIFLTININVFSVIFGKFYSVEQVGIYNQGQKWAWMGNQFIAGMINAVTQPLLVHVNEDQGRQVNVLRKLIRFSAFLSFPLMLGLAFVGREFILITIGEKWLSSVPFLQLFCIWGAFGFLSTLYTNLIFTHGKSTIYMYGAIVIGCLQLLVVWCMYPFGIFPMVIAYLAMNFVGLLIWQFVVHKLVRLRFWDVLKDIVPYFGITLGCFAVAWFFTQNIVNVYMLMGAKIAISGILYILILKGTRSVIFKESMEFLLTRKKQ